MEFKYKASIIIPVYNVEEYLPICLDSLVNQTMDKSQMEVLVINDGSPDNSWDICLEYSEKYDFIKSFKKENEGLSATRNFGIKHAQGKYLFFLDSDDYFTESTVKSVTEFFDKVYDEVDLVAYNEARYKGDIILKPHYRFQYLQKEGVYDLNENPYIAQTRINVCVKNVGENNILFDTTPGFKLEDQDYCDRVLMDKMKLGYCPDGTYMYNKGNESSIMGMYFHAYYLFETSMKHFENLFEYFEDKVPPYYQSMFLSDIIWRLTADILYPYHYSEEEFAKAMKRFENLLNRVDVETILNQPNSDIYRACYWIQMKTNSQVVFNQTEDNLELIIDDNSVYEQKDFTVIVQKPRINEDKFKMTGFIKSPIFNFLDEKDYDVYAVENGEYKKLDTFLSVHSHYRAKVVTNTFPAFHYECDLKEIGEIQFAVRIKDYTYSTHYWCMPYAGFNRFKKKIARGNYIIDNKKTHFKVKPTTQFKKDLLDVKNSLIYLKHPRVTSLRLKSISYRKKHRIWLYYDFYTVEKDNGFLQFANDLKHNDGIERYYVLTHEYENLDDVFTPEQQKHLVKFGSPEHRLLFVCAERIFTAYYGLAPVNPFDTPKMKYQYEDLIRFKTIYLQHGVLHASLRLQNSEERSQAEGIIVSSPFEVENYMKNYAYQKDDLITTGMARYDYIDKTKSPKNRILFAPSWRKYLTTEIKASNWDVNIEKIKKSDYYNNFMAFLSNKNLHKCLEENDIYLDIKLHPIITGVKGMFEIDCENINVVNGDVDVSDYKAFVTDFSSFVFDFAYLERPIMYFVPDYPQFKSGMNHYRDLDLPFEDAFGKMFTQADEAADCLCQIINNKFIPEEIYAERMKKFYFDFDGNCAENLYQYIKKSDKLEENQ